MPLVKYRDQVASFCSTFQRAFPSISYYYLLAILSLPHSLLNCTPRSLLPLSRSLLSLLCIAMFILFLWISAGSHRLRHPSALSVVELYMYLLLTFPVASNACLRATHVSLVPCALIPSCSSSILFIRHYSRDSHSC